MQAIFYSLIVITAMLPLAVFAQDDNNLVNLPIGETGDFNDYINAVYLMFISIAALIAVVKIIIAGVKYMFSDIVTQKSDAKNDIKGALLGLLVVLSAVVVLTIINPDLATFDPDISAIDPRERPEVSITPESRNIATVRACRDSDGCEIQGCAGTRTGDIGLNSSVSYDCTEARLECEASDRVVGGAVDDGSKITCVGVDRTDPFTVALTNTVIGGGESLQDAVARVAVANNKTEVYSSADFDGSNADEFQKQRACLSRGGNEIVFINSTDGTFMRYVCLQ